MNRPYTKHHRRSIRLRGYDYSRPGWYFVTIDLSDKEISFGTIANNQMILNEWGKIVQDWWLKIPRRYKNIRLDAFIVMPDHIHGIIRILQSNSFGEIGKLPQQLPVKNQMQRWNMLLPKIMGYFKMNSAKEINQNRNIVGVSVWHRNYYEHIIRNENELQRIRKYIIHNPRKWKNDPK